MIFANSFTRQLENKFKFQARVTIIKNDSKFLLSINHMIDNVLVIQYLIIHQIVQCPYELDIIIRFIIIQGREEAGFQLFVWTII